MPKFYISDMHFGHKNIINLDNRPFTDLDEMRNTMISNWNSVVSNGDDIYVLGDMFWNNNEAPAILEQLKGRKHLVVGNHDRLTGQIEKYFESISYMKCVKDGKKHIVLCHYPIAHWLNADHGYIHLYGHVHTGRDSRPFEEYVKQMQQREAPYKCYNVGAMLPYMNYTPRTLMEIRIANGYKPKEQNRSGSNE